jgi:hypothetical protein
MRQREQSDEDHETDAYQEPRKEVRDGSGERFLLIELLGFLEDVDAEGIGKIVGECGNEKGAYDKRLRRVRSTEPTNQGRACDDCSGSTITDSARPEHFNRPLCIGDAAAP